jgi:hypothetical protein
VTHKDDLAELQKRATAIDARLVAYRARPPKQRDHAGELDLQQAGVRVVQEIARLGGPLRPTS